MPSGGAGSGAGFASENEDPDSEISDGADGVDEDRAWEDWIRNLRDSGPTLPQAREAQEAVPR